MGPLPSSIYWRRRAVVLLLLVVLVLLVSWAVRSCGAGAGGDEQQTGNEKDDGNAQGPAESITPGPASSSGSLIEERPGGREESESGDSGGDSGGGESGDDGDDAAGETGDYGYGGYGGDGGSGETTGTDGEDGGSGGGEDVGGLPACTTTDVTLSLRADENDYARGEEPDLRVTVENDSGASCRVDFGHDALTVTIADAEDERVWSSDACPSGAASVPTAVPAGGSASHTIHWDRRHSTRDCEDSPGEPAASGTYVAEAHLGSLPAAQTSFRLDQD